MIINLRHIFGLFSIMSLLATPSLAETNQPKESQGGTSQQQTVVPLPQGGLKSAKSHTLVGDSVKDKNGQTIGTLNSIIVDTANGNVIAGVIKLALPNGRSALEPVAWKNIEIDPQSAEVRLKQSLKELVPPAVSPYVREILQGMEK